MIEKILKDRGEIFHYGEVIALNPVDRKALIRIRYGRAWVKTDLDLTVGNTVILARGADSSRFIVQHSEKALPETEVLLLI